MGFHIVLDPWCKDQKAASRERMHDSSDIEA